MGGHHECVDGISVKNWTLLGSLAVISDIVLIVMNSVQYVTDMLMCCLKL